MRVVDYIIVGQGLAGSCLALELWKRDKRFVVIDLPDPNSASKVAAGLFNPITGKTNQPTWRATELFDVLPMFYSQAENLLQDKFLVLLPIYRPFISREESMSWRNENNAWVNQVFSQSPYPESLHDPFGGIEIKKSGFINTVTFLQAARQFLQSTGNLVEEHLDFQELTSGDILRYKNVEASKIIFCEGTKVEVNPWFNWLPVRKLKGELLSVKGTLPSDRIVNRGIFSVPAYSLNQFLIGSTYQHDASPGNTQSGVEEISTKAKKMFKSPFEIVNQIWGHRPTTIDRRPILGSHPTHKNICVFNGLGTKGVTLAPFFAVHLANWLAGILELDKEVNIERFYSLYFKSNKP